MALRRKHLWSAVRWGSTLAAVAVVVVGIGSRWYCWQVTSHVFVAEVDAGRLSIIDTQRLSGLNPGWKLMRRADARLYWRFITGTHSSADALLIVEIPMWMLAAPMVGLAVLTWRRHTQVSRREARRERSCMACGYDLVGLGGGARCPECGVSVEP